MGLNKTLFLLVRAFYTPTLADTQNICPFEPTFGIPRKKIVFNRNESCEIVAAIFAGEQWKSNKRVIFHDGNPTQRKENISG